MTCGTPIYFYSFNSGLITKPQKWWVKC